MYYPHMMCIGMFRVVCYRVAVKDCVAFLSEAEVLAKPTPEGCCSLGPRFTVVLVMLG